MAAPDSISTDGSFPATHWSAVLAAGQDGSRAAGALAELCRTYWYPLYAHARRSGYAPADAKDLTQGFFLEMISGGGMTRATAERGRFRSFLVGAFRRYQASPEARRSIARLDGFAIPGLPEAEQRFMAEASRPESPDRIFDRHWATTVLDEAFALLEREFERAGRNALFDRLHPYLQGDREGTTHAEAAAALGTTTGTVKVTVHRMRQRYRQLVRSVVLQTLSDPAELDDELGHLMAVLRG